MNKKIITGVFVGIIGFSLLISGGNGLRASQAEEKPNLLNKEAQPEIVEVGAGYMGRHDLFQGKVKGIEANQGYQSVLIAGPKMDMVANINDQTPVYRQKDKALISLDQVAKDEEVVIVYDRDTPVTLSLPPRISNVKALIIKDKDYVAQLGVLDQNLMEKGYLFEVMANDQMKVLSLADLKKNLNPAALKDAEGLFLLKESEIDSQLALSRTPKYNMDLAIILSNKEELDQYHAEREKIKTELDQAAVVSTYVPLRKLAEAKGYKVEWFGMDKPIVLTKKDIRLEVTLNTKTLKYTHRTKDIHPLDKVAELDLMTVLEGSTTMVSSQLIDMLL